MEHIATVVSEGMPGQTDTTQHTSDLVHLFLCLWEQQALDVTVAITSSLV